MMAMPICDNMVIDRPLVNTRGATTNISANNPQTSIRLAFKEPDFSVGAKVATAMVNQPSRLPSRPLGRKIKISTINRYGRMGATCDKRKRTSVLLRTASPRCKPVCSSTLSTE